MSKKTKKILAVIISILLIVLVAYLFFYKNKDGASGLDIARGLFPFGSGGTNVPDEGVDSGDVDGAINGQGENTSLPRLFQIHKTPIAGATSFQMDTADDITKTIARYIERGVGHIFDTDISTMDESRVSNITRLKIYEAIWGNDAKNVVIRYLDEDDQETIRSFAIKLSDDINNETIPGEELLIQDEEVEGLFLPKNISAITISPDSKEIFYIIDTGNTAIGTIYNFTSGNSSQVFSSEFTEWLPQWPNEDTITLTTKPSGGVPGILYSLNTNTEELTKELGGINGLTTLTSPDGENVLYSESTRNGITLNIYNTSDKSSRKLPLTTLPEKCVWSKLNLSVVYCAVPTSIQSGLYPDMWYQGSISFDDEIWIMNVGSNRTTLVVNPQDASRESMDIVNPIMNEYEDVLFFTNKNDLSLWGARLYIF